MQEERRNEPVGDVRLSGTRKRGLPGWAWVGIAIILAILVYLAIQSL